MNNTVKIAMGGMTVAIGTVFMLLSSAIPFFEYAVPAMAGLLILFYQRETGKGWGLAAYAATSILSVFLVPQKEAVGMYIALFGLYPIIKSFFDKLPKALAYVLKCLYFIGVVVAAYYIMINIFGINSDFLEDFSKYTLPILLAVGLVAFVIYDRALFLFGLKYGPRYHKAVVKMFRKR